MTTQHSPETQLDDVSIRQLLEGLGRLHRLVLVNDTRGRVVWMSDALARLCGGGPGFRAEHVDDLVAKMPDPQSAGPIRADVREFGHVFNRRLVLEAHDGERCAVDISVFPVTNGDASEPLFISIARPVEEIEAPDPEQRDGRDPLGAILDSAPDAVIALDRRGFITYANAAVERQLRYTASELLDKPIVLFCQNAVDLERMLMAMQPTGEIREQTLELRRGDGSTLSISASASVLQNSDKRAAGTVIVFRDATERRRGQSDLERKNAELEHWVNTISHDLRSPLVALLGFSRLLRQDYGDQMDDTGNHFLDRIEQAARTMESLVHDLLELSRIGKPGERACMIDPRSVLLQIQAELKPRLEKQAVHLAFSKSPPAVYCDRTRLYQIFSNLIGNALDHMGPRPDARIEIEISDEGRAHRLTVRDNGKGIDPEHHQRIFEIFHSLGPRSDGHPSTGIGLAIVKKIAETRGGSVTVDSRPGQGTAFHVLLSKN